MKRTSIPGLDYWGIYQPDRRIDFNGFYWRREDGGVLIDPMPLAEHQLAIVEGDVAPRWIVLTNADHLRDAPALRERFGAKLLAPASDRNRLEGQRIDAWYGPDRLGGETTPLPDELADDIEVHWIRGGKTDNEAALYLAPLRTVVFGDVVRAHDSGVLRLLPDEKLQCRERVVRDVTWIAHNWNFEALLLGDGDPMFRGAKGAFLDFVRELST